MSQRELLKRVSDALASLRIDWMLTGSVAAAVHGSIRSAHDIDLVVCPYADAALSLPPAFAPPEYVIAQVAPFTTGGEHLALRQTSTAHKVDLWPLGDDAYDIESFTRRTRIDYHGAAVFVSTPEDTILKKLQWSQKSGGSEKQMTDVLAVARFNRATLDRGYIERWAKKIGVHETWISVAAQLE